MARWRSLNYGTGSHITDQEVIEVLRPLKHVERLSSSCSSSSAPSASSAPSLPLQMIPKLLHALGRSTNSSRAYICVFAEDEESKSITVEWLSEDYKGSDDAFDLFQNVPVWGTDRKVYLKGKDTFGLKENERVLFTCEDYWATSPPPALLAVSSYSSSLSSLSSPFSLPYSSTSSHDPFASTSSLRHSSSSSSSSVPFEPQPTLTVQQQHFLLLRQQEQQRLLQQFQLQQKQQPHQLQQQPQQVAQSPFSLPLHTLQRGGSGSGSFESLLSSPFSIPHSFSLPSSPRSDSLPSSPRRHPPILEVQQTQEERSRFAQSVQSFGVRSYISVPFTISTNPPRTVVLGVSSSQVRKWTRSDERKLLRISNLISFALSNPLVGFSSNDADTRLMLAGTASIIAALYSDARPPPSSSSSPSRFPPLPQFSSSSPALLGNSHPSSLFSNLPLSYSAPPSPHISAQLSSSSSSPFMGIGGTSAPSYLMRGEEAEEEEEGDSSSIIHVVYSSPAASSFHRIRIVANKHSTLGPM